MVVRVSIQLQVSVLVSKAIIVKSNRSGLLDTVNARGHRRGRLKHFVYEILRNSRHFLSSRAVENIVVVVKTDVKKVLANTQSLDSPKVPLDFAGHKSHPNTFRLVNTQCIQYFFSLSKHR